MLTYIPYQSFDPTTSGAGTGSGIDTKFCGKDAGAVFDVLSLDCRVIVESWRYID